MIEKEDRRPAGRLSRKAAALLAVIAIAVVAALLMPRGGREEHAPIDGVRTYGLAEVAAKCAPVKPMLARALADDRIYPEEADAIEAEARRLARISSDALLMNAARTSADVKPLPEPAYCSIPFGMPDE